VVEYSTTDPEVEGSNPDTTRHQEEIAEKKVVDYFRPAEAAWW
jgi:hypothetical protein